MNFTFVHNLFTARLAVNTVPRAGNDPFDGSVQEDFLHGQHDLIGHSSIGLHLREVVTRLIWDEGEGLLADIQCGRDADNFSSLRIYKGGGGFAVIFHAQGAVTDGAIRRGGETVCETAVGFGNDEESLAALIRFELQSQHPPESDADSQNLARTHV